jgi:hypothetical protein
MTDNAERAAKLAPFQITMSGVKLIARPDGNSTEWDKGASHWQVVLYRVGKGNPAGLVTCYSMGSAHKGAPKLLDVLASLLLDARCADEPFESWCADMGYDTDSRRALATYEACAVIGKEMRQLFTRDELRELDEIFADY